MSPTHTIVREFLKAVKDPNTYLPWKNLHLIFGFLWGLPIPIFALAIHCAVEKTPPSAATVIRCFQDLPLHYFFLAHPFLFAFLFGAMGTVRHSKDREIRELLQEREEKVRQLAAANQLLREMDGVRNDFLANVSHDLKTPLVSISGYAEMIQTGRLGVITLKQRDASTVILRNVEALLGMINDLLDLARLRCRKVPMKKETFLLESAVEDCRAEFEPRIREKGIAFLSLLPPGLEVRGDRRKIVRIFDNLISNATKFCGEGGMIRITADPPRDGRIRVRVSDNGCGIPEHLRHGLFERFWRGDISGNQREKGTGLGLSIAREIVEMHEGTIEVESRVGEGSDFRFDLPAAEPAAVEQRKGMAV